MTENIIDQHRIVLITQIEPNPWNPNVQSDREYEAVKESLQDHGQVQALLVRRLKKDRYQVVDGEHRWRAISEMGWEHVLVNDLGKMPDPVAMKLTEIMNETKGHSDPVKLSKMLREIEAYFGADLIRGLPYSDKQLSDVMNLTDADWLKDFANPDWTDEEGEDGTVKFVFHVQRLAAPVLQYALDCLNRDEGFSSHKAIEMIVVEWLQGRPDYFDKIPASAKEVVSEVAA